MYNGAGKWIVDVGIPAKSGVAGLVMCVVPGVCGFAVFSPRLDPNGNSARGVLVAAAMSEQLGLHVLKRNNHDHGSSARSPHHSNSSTHTAGSKSHSKAHSKVTPVTVSGAGYAAGEPSNQQRAEETPVQRIQL